MNKTTHDITEQLDALTILRKYARLVPKFINPTAGELNIAHAIRVLDEAGRFADLDQTSGPVH